MTDTTQILPKLRFPEFENDGEWKVVKLGDIAQFFKGKGISKAEVSNTGTTPCIRYGELYTYYKEVVRDIKSYTNIPTDNLVLSKANDVIIPSSGETKEDISTASCIIEDGIALGGDINIIRSSANGIFLSYYLNNAKKNDIAKIAQGISIIHLYNEQLQNLSIAFPSLPEQQKIAAFLTSLDEQISAHTKKLEALKAHKKGLMQQLFPANGEKTPKLRFPEFRNAGEWEDVRLGEVFKRITDRNKENNNNVLTISAQYGLVNQYEYFSKNIAATDVTNYYIIKKGDFAYNKSRSQGYPYGAIKPLKLYDKGVVSTLYICFRTKEQNSCIDFYEHYFETDLIHNEICKIAQEGARNHGLLNISTEDFFEKISLFIPSFPEQQKIASFLSSIDEMIQAQDDKIRKLKTYKNGLMQQMFQYRNNALCQTK